MAILAIVSLTGAASAREERPKIGIALGGGGARGFAHIGVLRWMEEHHVPVDYIAGTSIGALMGGVYAAGYSPNEIEAIVREVDWTRAFLRETPYELKDFRRKEDRAHYPVKLEVGLQDGINMPSGLDPVHPIGLLINRITLPYSGIDSFDELATPFRAVAVDLGTGEEVVLGSGPLSASLRASMAIPGLFTPVQIEDRILVDGGALNNVPADVARSMGADVVIAVDVGSPLADPELLTSWIDMIGQTVGVMMLQNTRRTLQQADIVLAPELKDVNTLSWYSLDSAVKDGYQAAASKETVLSRFALEPADWEQHVAEREERILADVPAPSFLEVAGVTGEAADSVATVLARHVGRRIDVAALEDDLTRLTGSGRFDSLGYRLVEREEGHGLLISVQRKPYGPPFARFGIGISGAEADDVALKLGSRVTWFDVGPFGSEVRLDIGIGASQLASGEYLLPFAGSRFFIAPSAFFSRERQDVYGLEGWLSDYRVRRTGISVDLGWAISRNSELRVGYQVANLDTASSNALDFPSDISGKERGPRLRYVYDGRDAPEIPTRGMRAEAAAWWFDSLPGPEDDLHQIELRLGTFRPYRRLGTLFGTVGYGSSLGNAAPGANRFTLGGPLRLGAYSHNEFRGSNYILGALGYLRPLSRLPSVLGSRAYLGLWAEYGAVYEDWDEADFHANISAGYILDSVLGPVLVGLSWGEEGRERVYFSLGRIFD